MNEPSNIQALIRHILTFAGGYIIAKGYADETLVMEIAGGAAAVIGGVWSIIKEQKRKKLTDVK